MKIKTLAQLSIWRRGLTIFDIATQLNSLKIKWTQRLLNPTNALWKDLMLYRLNLILSSNQGLALLRQKQILRSNRHKNLQRQNNEDFFIQLLNAWLHFTNNNFHTPAPIDEILDQPKFLTNQHLTNTPNWTLALTTHISILSHLELFQTYS